MRPAPWVVGAGVAVAAAALLALVAQRRIVNADEGFYGLAAVRVLDGLVPYADFFFPQMPYLPYLQAGAFRLGGVSLRVARAVSVLAGGALAGLVAAAAARQGGGPAVGVLAGAAFLAHALVLSYLPIAKPYAVASLGAVAACVLLAGRAPGVREGLLAGLCLAVAVGARLPVAAAGPVLLALAGRGGARPAAAFLAGALCGSLPWIAVAAADPSAFWFNNVGFHGLRREISGIAAVAAQKAEVLTKWVLLPQNLVLWAGAVAALRMAPRQAAPPLACAVALGAAYLAATPSYLEYFVQLAPFLLLAAVPALAALRSRPVLLAGIAAVYLAGLAVAQRPAPADTERGAKDRLWNLGTVEGVARYVAAHSAPDDRVLSWWEGYPWLAGRRGYLGAGFWESNAARKVSPEERRRYHVLHRDDVRALVLAGEPRIVVYPEGVWAEVQAVIGRHYRLLARFDSIQVYGRVGG